MLACKRTYVRTRECTHIHTCMHAYILKERDVAISRSSQCSTTGVTKAVVCAILSVGCCIYERILAATARIAHLVDFLSRHLNDPLAYVRRHITVEC